MTMPLEIHLMARLLVPAVLGQSRVFLRRRIIFFDHEFYGHAVQLLAHESPIDHCVRQRVVLAHPRSALSKNASAPLG